MAVNYYEKKYKNFWHIIFRMFAIIAGFTLICEVGAYLLGNTGSVMALWC